MLGSKSGNTKSMYDTPSHCYCIGVSETYFSGAKTVWNLNLQTSQAVNISGLNLLMTKKISFINSSTHKQIVSLSNLESSPLPNLNARRANTIMTRFKL